MTLLYLLLSSVTALGGRPVRLANQTTQVVMEAEANGPCLLGLHSGSSEGWHSPGCKNFPALIDHAEIQGKERPLRWRYRADLSSSDAKQVVFVYDTADRALRLRWEWRSRADRGPIEHSVSIENRGSREIWLPLQESLALQWYVDAARPLEQLWIDKGASHAPPVGTHLAPVASGSTWTGTSSPYAHPDVEDVPLCTCRIAALAHVSIAVSRSEPS